MNGLETCRPRNQRAVWDRNAITRWSWAKQRLQHEHPHLSYRIEKPVQSLKYLFYWADKSSIVLLLRERVRKGKKSRVISRVFVSLVCACFFFFLILMYIFVMKLEYWYRLDVYSLWQCCSVSWGPHPSMALCFGSLWLPFPILSLSVRPIFLLPKTQACLLHASQEKGWQMYWFKIEVFSSMACIPSSVEPLNSCSTFGRS